MQNEKKRLLFFATQKCTTNLKQFASIKFQIGMHKHQLGKCFLFDSDVFDDNSIAKCNQNQSILLWDISD